MCTNLIGSYYCSCQDGYRLQDNMHICEGEKLTSVRGISGHGRGRGGGVLDAR